MLIEMEIITLEEKENPFFKRKEILVLIKHDASATPSKSELVKTLAATHSVDESQVVVDYIFSKSGVSESFAKIKILAEKPKAEAEKEKQEEKKVEAQAGQNP